MIHSGQGATGLSVIHLVIIFIQYTFSPIVGTKWLGQQFLATDIVTKGPIVTLTPTISNCRSQKLLGQTLLPGK